ncbi:MAG: hypothetical protein CENE_02661 [Candidatus Celerinatantimonas neptuna]|nr:MAG: hypothetical protein CENE_02661 [Candidatus Celerinatantimonas neptuna]
MAITNQNLIFDIDTDELKAIKQMFGANERDMRKAYNRALNRTAVTVQSMSARLLKDELSARKLSAVRARLRHYRLRADGPALSGLKLWFGLNDMPVSQLKGTIRRLGSRKNPDGAQFTPSAQELSARTFRDSFIAKLGSRRSVYHRKGRKRFPVSEDVIAISDALHVRIEDDIFDQLPKIFLHHYTTDLKGRVAKRNAS